MVARLASRLEQSPDDLDGWLRLGQAYTVLGEREKAADAFRKAKGLMKSDDPRLAELDKRIADLAKSGGTAPAEPPGR
jgi:cytochrome c-type biogenesis protein CcmH